MRLPRRHWLGCEGIVSKRLGSHYRSGRVDHWLTIKNSKSPAVRREREDRGAKRWASGRRRKEIYQKADALTLVSETMDESPHANAINRLAWEIKRRGETAEKRRQDLSLLVNPDRSQDP
jgi:hypothetical protein